MSPITLLAIALLVAGAVTSILPQVPGEMPLSIAGIYLYWWHTGYSDPSTTVLFVLTLLCLLVICSQFIGPVIMGKLSGTPAVTTSIGSFVGGVLFLLWGKVGLVVGTLGTVFILEYRRRGDVVESVVAAFTVVLAGFAQKVVKVAVALFVLAAMIVIILL
ncbi:DUF456 family protein [Halovenus rubra]|uniref:DUF456 family protein n=2 Tax=Halovenus rubra TaxID=869890 RepID=A0ABD5X8L0_9EURY|nr:DUF456 family protein [Halovenus rubra]